MSASAVAIHHFRGAVARGHIARRSGHAVDQGAQQALVDRASARTIGRAAGHAQQGLAIACSVEVLPVPAGQVQGGPAAPIGRQFAQGARGVAIVPHGDAEPAGIAVALTARTIGQQHPPFVGDEHIGVVIRRRANQGPVDTPIARNRHHARIGQSGHLLAVGRDRDMVKALPRRQHAVKVDASDLHRIGIGRTQLGEHQLVVLEALAVGKAHRAGRAAGGAQAGGRAGHLRPSRAVPGQRRVRAQQHKARGVAVRLVVGAGEVDAVDNPRHWQGGEQAAAGLGRVDILGAPVAIEGRRCAAAKGHHTRRSHVRLGCHQPQLGQLHRAAGRSAAAQGIAQAHFADLHAIGGGCIAQIDQHQLVVLEALRIGEGHGIAGPPCGAQAGLAGGKLRPARIRPGQIKVRTQQHIAHRITVSAVVAGRQGQGVDHRRVRQGEQQACIDLVAVEVLAVTAPVYRFFCAFAVGRDRTGRGRGRGHGGALLGVDQLVVAVAGAVGKADMAGAQTRFGQAGGARCKRTPARVVPGEVFVGAKQRIPGRIALRRILARSEVQPTQHISALQIEQQARRGRLDVHELVVATGSRHQHQIGQARRGTCLGIAAQGAAKFDLGDLHADGRRRVAQVGQHQLVVLEALAVVKTHRVGGAAHGTQTGLAGGNLRPAGIGPGQLCVGAQQDIAHRVAIGPIVTSGQVQGADHRLMRERDDHARIHLVAVEVPAGAAAIDGFVHTLTATDDRAWRRGGRDHDRPQFGVSQLVVLEAACIGKADIAAGVARLGQVGRPLGNQAPATLTPRQQLVGAKQRVTGRVALRRISAGGEVQPGQHRGTRQREDAPRVIDAGVDIARGAAAVKQVEGALGRGDQSLGGRGGRHQTA